MAEVVVAVVVVLGLDVFAAVVAVVLLAGVIVVAVVPGRCRAAGAVEGIA